MLGIGSDVCTCLAVIQQVLLITVAWVSFGVYGSYYVLRSLAHSKPRVDRRHSGAYFRESDVTRIVTDYAVSDDGAIHPLESIPFPDSWKALRFSALVVLGTSGPAAVVVSIAVALIGWKFAKARRWVMLHLAFGGPDWTTTLE